MTRRRTLVHFLMGLFLASLPVRASADSIPLEGFGPFPFRPGDILRAEFDVRALLEFGSLEGYDVLVFSPGVSVVNTVDSFTTRVYDRGQSSRNSPPATTTARSSSF